MYEVAQEVSFVAHFCFSHGQKFEDCVISSDMFCWLLFGEQNLELTGNTLAWSFANSFQSSTE